LIVNSFVIKRVIF